MQYIATQTKTRTHKFYRQICSQRDMLNYLADAFETPVAERKLNDVSMLKT